MIADFEYFISWLFSTLANFLSSEPIIYFVGIYIVFFVIAIIFFICERR